MHVDAVGEHRLDLEAQVERELVEREDVDRIADGDGEDALDLEERQHAAEPGDGRRHERERLVVRRVAREVDARDAHLVFEHGLELLARSRARARSGPRPAAPSDGELLRAPASCSAVM